MDGGKGNAPVNVFGDWMNADDLICPDYDSLEPRNTNLASRSSVKDNATTTLVQDLSVLNPLPMSAIKTVRTLMKRFEPHLPKSNPSAFSTSFCNYMSKHNLIKSVLLDKKPNATSIPTSFSDSRCLGNVPRNLFSHLMHRDCFGVGCIVREGTLPEWKDRLMIVRAVESRMGARIGDVKGDILSVDAETKGGRIVKRNVVISELVALSGKWTVVEDMIDPIKPTDKAPTIAIKRGTKDTIAIK